VWVQAGNAEAATSAGLPRGIEGGAAVTQQSLFQDGIGASPLNGLHLRLEGEYARGCCKNVAIVGKGPRAELRCADCGKHCGWLPKAAASWLLDVFAFWPEAKNETHALRNVKGTDPRGSENW
jgi:hypothetical protein